MFLIWKEKLLFSVFYLIVNSPLLPPSPFGGNLKITGAIAHRLEWIDRKGRTMILIGTVHWSTDKMLILKKPTHPIESLGSLDVPMYPSLQLTKQPNFLYVLSLPKRVRAYVLAWLPWSCIHPCKQTDRNIFSGQVGRYTYYTVQCMQTADRPTIFELLP